MIIKSSYTAVNTIPHIYRKFVKLLIFVVDISCNLEKSWYVCTSLKYHIATHRSQLLLKLQILMYNVYRTFIFSVAPIEWYATLNSSPKMIWIQVFIAKKIIQRELSINKHNDMVLSNKQRFILPVWYQLLQLYLLNST